MNKNNKIINIDKIHIQFSEFVPIDFNKYESKYFIRIYRNTDKFKFIGSIYNEIFNIYYKSKFIGHLFSKPKTNKPNFQIHFKKELIYTDLDLLLRFYEDFVVENLIFFDGFSNLEIALNELDPTRWKEIFHIQCNLVDSNQYENPLFKSNSKGKIIIHSLQSNNLFIIANKKHSIENLEKESKKIPKVVIYKKTNLKSYQTDFYNRNRLPVDDHLYRTEVRLYRSFFSNLKKKGKQIEFSDLANMEILKKLFDSGIGDKLNFKDLTKPYYDSNRNKKFESKNLYDSKYDLNDLPDLIFDPNPSKPLNNPNRAKAKLIRDLANEWANNPSEGKEIALKEIVQINREIDLNYEFQKLINTGIDPEKLNQLKDKLKNNTYE